MILQTILIGGNRSVATGGPDAPPLHTLTDNIAALTALQVGGSDNAVVIDMKAITLDADTFQEPHPDSYVHSPDPVFSTQVIEAGTGSRGNRGFN